ACLDIGNSCRED
nr:RecName: Full=U7-ctenitoxin-Co1a; Short=U7-CNTX-Co1a; AltName: Full=Neurotoxin Oc F40-4 [Oligoctenus ornatus]